MYLFELFNEHKSVYKKRLKTFRLLENDVPDRENQIINFITIKIEQAGFQLSSRNFPVIYDLEDNEAQIYLEDPGIRGYSMQDLLAKLQKTGLSTDYRLASSVELDITIVFNVNLDIDKYIGDPRERGRFEIEG